MHLSVWIKNKHLSCSSQFSRLDCSIFPFFCMLTTIEDLTNFLFHWTVTKAREHEKENAFLLPFFLFCKHTQEQFRLPACKALYCESGTFFSTAIFSLCFFSLEFTHALFTWKWSLKYFFFLTLVWIFFAYQAEKKEFKRNLLFLSFHIFFSLFYNMTNVKETYACKVQLLNIKENCIQSMKLEKKRDREREMNFYYFNQDDVSFQRDLNHWGEDVK